MNAKVLLAVFKRNFISYFANPTGYVFICVFVLLSSFAAFWPNEFFNTNLANLDQLNKLFPFIMLVFIPAITMAVWADERRQGTDELLLTIPAGDFDIVLGKYLAAVAIYSVSLLFSLVCNYAVLQTLGDPDVGLFLGTYVGYWLIGLGMVAVGMAASFITANLTVAYILAAVFNAPLVFAVFADSIFSGDLALAVRQWSIGEQFRDFGRGILSFSGLVYFLMIVAVMLYLSTVLIGRRHWREGQGKLPNHVFYPVLHVLWLASFATFWLVLKDRFDPTNTFILLCVLYLLLHAGLLWGWLLLPGRAEAQPMDAADALIHFAVLVGFLVVTRFLKLYVDNSYVYLGAFIVYLVIHAGLFFAWLRFGGHAALLPGQYTLRVLALVTIAVAAVVLFNHYDWRVDATSEQLSSLSPHTVKLLRNLKIQRPVQIEAFVSPEVPELYVQTRVDLLSMLRELDARGGEKVRLTVNNTERFSEEAARAEKRYEITPRRVVTMSRGRLSEDHLFMGVAFTCGLEKVILPFIDRGIPVEYELVRSIATVTQQQRKKIGILKTDAQLYGGFDFQTGTSSSNWPIVGELEKQYEVEEVDPTSPITDRYDALLAVQPSSLGPDGMDNFLDAVKSGQPTAIFEDPYPYFAMQVPATSAPRRMPGGMSPWMRGQPPEKGDILPLWATLGIDFGGDQIIWQDYNPYPKLSRLPKEFVFVDEGIEAREPFNENDPISSKLQHMLFPLPGSVAKLHASPPNLKFTPLVQTGLQTGTVRYFEAMQWSPFGPGGDLNPARRQIPTNVSYILAAHIQGKLPADLSHDDDKDDEDEAQSEGDKAEDEAEKERPKQNEVNVVLVTDIDMLHEAFFRLREQGPIPEAGIRFDFDNVTFVLNVLDVLAGDERFLDLRKRRPKHRTLTRIEKSTEKARQDTAATTEKLRTKFDDTKEKEEQRLKDRVKKLEERMKKENLDPVEIATRVALFQQDGERRMQAKLDRLEQERDKEINRIETDLNLEIRRVQNRYKKWAVVLPPVPPLLVALAVLFTRRRREREGVAQSRLRS